MSEQQQDLPTEPSKKRMVLHLVVVSISFLLAYTAFKGVLFLQSSLNREGGVGTISLSCIYLSTLLSTIFLPRVFIKKLGVKNTMMVCLLLYSPYMIAQGYPRFYTLVPTALLLGVAAGPLWVAKCVFLGVIADHYALVSKIPVGALVSRMFGTFYMIFNLSQVLGNVISSVTLTYVDGEDKGHDGDPAPVCGPDFCPGSERDNPNFSQPSFNKVLVLAAVYVICIVTAVAVIFLLIDPIDNQQSESLERSTGRFVVMATWELFAYERRQWMLLPISLFTGLAKAFLVADYTASYVACSWGIRNIGYVMVVFGLTSSLSGALMGWLVHRIGRHAVLGFSMLGKLALLVGLILWAPASHHTHWLFVVAAVWAVFEGGWMAQTNAVVGVLFPGQVQAAFTNFKVWNALGYLVGYAYSPYVCTWVKILVLILVNIAGTVGYFCADPIKFWRRRAPAPNIQEEEEPESRPAGSLSVGRSERHGIVVPRWSQCGWHSLF